MTYKLTNISDTFITVGNVVLKPKESVEVPNITTDVSVLQANKKLEVIPIAN